VYMEIVVIQCRLWNSVIEAKIGSGERESSNKITTNSSYNCGSRIFTLRKFDGISVISGISDGSRADF